MPDSPLPAPERATDSPRNPERETDSPRRRGRETDSPRKRERNRSRDGETDEHKGSSSRRSREERDRDRERSSRDGRYDRERERDRERRKRRERSHHDSDRDRDRDRARDRDRERDGERVQERRDGDGDRDCDRPAKDGESDGEGRTRRRDRDRDDRYDEERRKRRREERRRERRESRSRSPSERQKRKEAKAAARREADAEHARKLTELSMYSAVDNPFHDANINEQFTWHKKREKEKKAGLTPDEIARKDALRRLEAKEELEKLNKKRADREVQMRLREEEESKMRRMAEDAAMAAWIAKEDDFQLEQSRRRAGIRLRMQRARAIDFLAINLRFADASALGRTTAAIGALTNRLRAEIEREEEEEGWGWADAGFEFEIDEPWKIFENLTMEDCVELEQDIKMYLSLEKSLINIDFWEAMLVVCQHHLEQFRNPDRAVGGRLYNKEVDEAAGKIVSGLSLQRLSELEDKTREMVSSGQPVDGEFWDLVLKKIHVQKAISRLNSIHEVVLKNRLEQFKKRQREDAAKVQAELGGIMEPAAAAQTDGYGGDMHAEGEEAENSEDEDDFVEEYAPEMSPPPVDMTKLDEEEQRLPVVNEEDLLRALFAARRTVSADSFVPRSMGRIREEESVELETTARPVDNDLEAERAWREAAAHEPRDWGDSESEEEMEDGDLAEGLDSVPATYDWSDKFRPRKPRYYNRVHTGYEWTTYNQTHYDKENPPPKVVQGYKFNIFYPDLIDKTKTPTYIFKRIPADPDTHIIIFTAGPPYEDIAFRIVRKPWEYSHRRGFKSNFDRGVLQLYFNFSRQYYKK